MFQGKLIKYHRTRKKMTQKELATGICSVSYLSKIENETIEPSEDVLQLLGDRLHISLDMQEDNEDIEERILNWNDLIKNKNYEKAHEEYNNLQKIYHGTNNRSIKYLFLTIEFGYLLTFENDNRIVAAHYKQLREMKELFPPLTNYYFHKLESLYFYNRNDLINALEALKEAEEVYPAVNVTDSTLYYNLAIFYNRTDQLYKSLHYAFKSLRETQANFDFHMITGTLILLGSLYIRIGEYDYAEREFLKLKKEEARLNSDFTALTYHNLGYIYYQQKKYEQAIHHLNIALENSNTVSQVDTIYVLCLIYYTVQNDKLFENTLELGKKLANKKTSNRSIYKFYILETKKNKQVYHSTVINKIENEIIPYFKEAGEQQELLRLYKLLGDVYFHNRQYKKAGEYYQLTHQYYSNTFMIEDYI
ncbi:tetratricopeptide repeat protein [Virgibacillus sp. MSP4-1]|uniref:helix-turn-helix transcriptional regulator n=1 Tax=Virgibacillus sp. MSP4-1 TaxID=2700081 RepID=UPI00039C444B|nr:helix-turn-helix transcriptional regulator [Virgibacillus sp. MSP4-1]QHS24065.1 tetratricopeptide repeat protein [Virgibacillus sp. MSP4-1]